MLTQNLSGQPKKCCNRLCRAPFTRESHLGYLPKSEFEVWTVLRCTKCNDTFLVSQVVSSAHDYYQKLPRLAPDNKRPVSPITFAEMKAMRNRLETDPGVLKSLFDGVQPGSGFTTRDEI